MNDDITVLSPINTIVARILVGAYLLWFVLTAGIPLMLGEHAAWWLMGFNVLLGIPLYMLADNVAASIRLDKEGICRTGLFKRQEKLGWADVSNIKLHSGRGRYREILLMGKKKTKMGLVTTRINLGWTNMRSEFWPAVRHVMTEAQARGIPVKAALGTHRESWFAIEHDEKPRIKR